MIEIKSVHLVFRTFTSEDDVQRAIQVRRRKLARDRAFALGRVTFTVFRNSQDTTLYAFALDHEIKPPEAITDLCNALNLTVYQYKIMPYYPVQLAQTA